MIPWARQRALVIAPHPDDEVIGCGATIRKIKDAGGEVHVHFLTVGHTADASETGFSSMEERLVEIKRVAQVLGFDSYDVSMPGSDHHLRLDTVSQIDLIRIIEAEGSCSLDVLKPTMVLLPFAHGYNQDHRAAATATLTALRPGGSVFRQQPELVLVYEQLADLWRAGPALDPDTFVEVSADQVAAKVEAMRTYASQDRPPPSTRSCEALESMAVYRGAQSGFELAEAFQLLRARW